MTDRDKAAVERTGRALFGPSPSLWDERWAALPESGIACVGGKILHGREGYRTHAREIIAVLCAGPLPRAVLRKAAEEFTEPERLEAACRRAARHSPQGTICWEGIGAEHAAEVVEVVLAELDAEENDV